MRDIVAAIQPEQDELVRAGPEDTICVQGMPARDREDLFGIATHI